MRSPGRHQICAVAGGACSTVLPGAGRPVLGDVSEAAGTPVLLSAEMALAGTQVLGAHAQWRAPVAGIRPCPPDAWKQAQRGPCRCAAQSSSCSCRSSPCFWLETRTRGRSSGGIAPHHGWNVCPNTESTAVLLLLIWLFRASREVPLPCLETAFLPPFFLL